MSYREWKAWKKEQKLKSKKKKKASSKILIESSDDSDSDHKRRLLALLSPNELLRKRIDTDVAFTREYTWDIESREW